ncbi:hypothetical protein GCM10017667_17600 [Streptomyces filamentosus]|uniref:Uncharacterized protein n=1 Tax=Streptomyces filamentosus TaxID=67294 RepID=A0A919BI99_STRFL|nr:hypothetical protein GCM10017667_17600 [Streptomyces filamentosus]
MDGLVELGLGRVAVLDLDAQGVEGGPGGGGLGDGLGRHGVPPSGAAARTREAVRSSAPLPSVDGRRPRAPPHLWDRRRPHCYIQVNARTSKHSAPSGMRDGTDPRGGLRRGPPVAFPARGNPGPPAPV